MDLVTAALVHRLMASLLQTEQERDALLAQVTDMRNQLTKKGKA